MEGLVSPILLYGACVVGALGVSLALPRKGLSPQLLGALIAAVGLGGIFLAMGLRTPLGELPNFNFYLFSLIALGAALRVISHPRPVYSALYFILTILASSGLYVLLSAEFMAFALVIVYAGAILITYLFVIMLATESPTADQVEALAEYDRYSREPVVATVVGFILIAGVTTMLARGVPELALPVQYAAAGRLQELPRKVETALREAELIGEDERIARDADGRYLVDLDRGEVVVAYGEGFAQTRVIRSDNPAWPADLALSNVEGVGFSLLADHPGGIEIAGVVLLMAMLGAVVLARKKVELDEQARAAAQQRGLTDERMASTFEPPFMAGVELKGGNGNGVHAGAGAGSKAAASGGGGGAYGRG